MDGMKTCKSLILLLLRYSDSLSTSASGFRVLSTNSQTPRVSQSTVSTNFLQTLKIFTHLGISRVGQDLECFAINYISLPVQEPVWNLVLLWILHYCHNSLEFFDSKFSGSLVEIDIGLFANQVRVSTTNTLDLCKGEHDLVLSIDIGIQ